MLISTEKACYPLAELAEKYPQSAYEWKYVNGGGWMVEIAFFIELARKYNLNKDSHDQIWLHNVYLSEREHNGVFLDRECEIFQTIAFEGPDDFMEVIYGDHKRIVNKKTGALPIFIHGNGHTDMTKIYNLLKCQS